MNLWPPYSEVMEFLTSTYCIVQLTSVKFYTLIKDDRYSKSFGGKQFKQEHLSLGLWK